jgi:hypothetical protein
VGWLCAGGREQFWKGFDLGERWWCDRPASLSAGKLILESGTERRWLRAVANSRMVRWKGFGRAMKGVGYLIVVVVAC